MSEPRIDGWYWVKWEANRDWEPAEMLQRDPFPPSWVGANTDAQPEEIGSRIPSPAEAQPVPARAEEPEEKTVNHIIGCAKQRQAAILVVEYLRDRMAAPLSLYTRGQMSYREHRKFGQSDIEHYEILISTPGWKLERDGEFVDTCRAFLAGYGDGHIWA